MDVRSRSRMAPATWIGRPAGPPSRATVWRAGQGAGTLAALCMLAAGTEAAGSCWWRNYGWPSYGTAGV